MTNLRQRILRNLIPFVALVLVLVGLGIDHAVQRDLLSAHETRLLDWTDAITGAVSLEPDARVELELDTTALHEFLGPDATAYYCLWAEDDRLLLSSGSCGGPPVQTSNQPRVRQVFRGQQAFLSCTLAFDREPEHDEFETLGWASRHPGETLPVPPHQTFRADVGLSLENLERSFTAFRIWLISGFLLLFGILALGPVWLVSRALRPLQALSVRAESLSGENLNVRLPVASADAEVRSLVAALNAALDRIAQAYERQRRFTADAAHELRTPLSVIRTECEVALRKDRDRPELRQALESIGHTAIRLGGLVEKLLTLSRFDEGAVEFTRRELDLARAARAVARMLSVSSEAKGIRLEVDLPRTLPVQGDEALLEECLLILLDNALQFTPVGGTIRLDGGSEPQPWLSVEDTGPGIEPDVLPKIFERFYRADPSRSRLDKGMGLGLSIAVSIARLHQAQILVSSQSGKGSRFELRLPAGV